MKVQANETDKLKKEKNAFNEFLSNTLTYSHYINLPTALDVTAWKFRRLISGIDTWSYSELYKLIEYLKSFNYKVPQSVEYMAYNMGLRNHITIDQAQTLNELIKA